MDTTGKVNSRQIGGDHYKTSYEHWDLAVNIPLGYLEGCATKYVARWRKKDGLKDLQKALHYLDKLIEVGSPYIARTIEVESEAMKFAYANKLSPEEAGFIYLLCSYEIEEDLQRARACLLRMISNEQDPNKPGTPADGGHHAR